MWSTDPEATKYRGISRLQAARLEIIVDLQKMVEDVLNRSKALPQNIVFFRDGVSEGEFEIVRHEIAAIKGTFNAGYFVVTHLTISAAFMAVAMERKVISPNFKLTFIVVGKR